MAQTIRHLFGRDKTEHRMREREEKVTRVVANKIEEEGVAKLEEAKQTGNDAKKGEAEELIETAKAVRGGEVSLLSAMGVVKRVD